MDNQEQKKRAEDLSILANMGIEVAEIHGRDEIVLSELMEGQRLPAGEGVDPLMASYLSSIGEDPSTYRRVECSRCGEVWYTDEEWEGVCLPSGGCGL